MWVSQKHIGSLILKEIQMYILTRAALLFTLCYEIPCTLKDSEPWNLCNQTLIRGFQQCCLCHWRTFVYFFTVTKGTEFLGVHEKKGSTTQIISISMGGIIRAPVSNFDLIVTFYEARENNLLLFGSKLHKTLYIKVR